MEDMTIIQLKDELRRRKMKTIGIKTELIKRLQTIIIVEEQKDDDFSDDEEKEPGFGKRDGQLTSGCTTCQQESHLLTLKNIEDSRHI